MQYVQMNAINTALWAFAARAKESMTKDNNADYLRWRQFGWLMPAVRVGFNCCVSIVCRETSGGPRSSRGH